MRCVIGGSIGMCGGGGRSIGICGGVGRSIGWYGISHQQSTLHPIFIIWCLLSKQTTVPILHADKAA